MSEGTGRSSSVAVIDRALPAIYLVLGLLLTGLLCFLTAPFFGPDEPHHAARAIALGHGVWLAHMGSTEAGAEIDYNAVRLMDELDRLRMAWERRTTDPLNRPYGAMAEDGQRRVAGVRWGISIYFAPYPNTAVYPPVLYLPATVGWRLGEATGLTVLWSLRLARGLCAVTAVLLGWLALRLCSCSRWVLLPFLLLPSTLFLNATCSQDAILLPVAGLVVAMLSRPLHSRRQFRPLELMATAALLALCATARPPYLGMAPLLFLPTVECSRGRWRRWMAPAVAFGTEVVLCGVWRHLVFPFGVDPPDVADPTSQMRFLRVHPLLGGWVILRGVTGAGADFVKRGLYVVGWNDLLAPRGLELATGVCVAVILLFGPAFPVRTWRGRLLLGACVLGPLFGISLAEYIIWTVPGGHVVYGVQPRYWLPLLPMGTALVQGVVFRAADADAGWGLTGVWRVSKLRGSLLTGATLMLAGVACTLPWVVAHAFYAESVGRVLWLNLHY